MIREELLEILPGSRGATMPEIEKALGYPHRSGIDRALSKLIQEGRVEKINLSLPHLPGKNKNVDRSRQPRRAWRKI